MATVTVFTSERMKEIEDNAIVSGEIVAGRLVLKKFNGTEIDAGIPDGAPWATVVDHDAVADTPRPAGAGFVVWRGTVTPTNMAVGDLYIDLS